MTDKPQSVGLSLFSLETGITKIVRAIIVRPVDVIHPAILRAMRDTHIYFKRLSVL